MLILRPVKGVWWIVSSSYPDGAWWGYTDPDAALAVIQWLTLMKIDCDGILRRLYFGKLTEADRRLVGKMNRATWHESRVTSKQEPVVDRLAKARLKAMNP